MKNNIKEIENLENLINVAKEEYIHTFERSNKLESKVSILMAFIAVFIRVIPRITELFEVPYNENTTYNNSILTKKYKIYDRAVHLLIITVILIIIKKYQNRILSSSRLSFS